VLLVEPGTHGGHRTIDDTLDTLYRGLFDAIPDRKTWGTLPHHQEAQRAAEGLFGPPPSDE